MSDRIRNFYMPEDTLAGVECAYSLILSDAIDWNAVEARPELRDALQMVKEALVEMRFPLPAKVVRIPAQEDPQ